MPPKQDEKFYSPGLQRNAQGVPELVRLPSAGDMKDMSASELIDTLQRYGVVASWDSMRADILVKNAKLAKLASKTEEELARRADYEADRELLGLCRRTQENYTTSMAVDGEEQQLLIRLPEDYDPARICDICADLAGTIGTMAEQEEVGLPGEASCLGGDSCRCTLVAVD
jgi:hypothetical protein